MADTEQQEVLIVTGMSGAGRSTVANALEDLDWYVVDNLPPQMLRPLIELANRAESGLPRIAAVVDVRGRNFFADLQEMIQTLREGTKVRVLFLEASDAVLVRRFEQVRRPHPLQGNGTILDGITAERARLREIRESSDLIVDTTEEDLDAIVGVNLKGVYWGIAAAGRVMSAAGRGSIVNVASAGGEMPAPTLSVYGMTKAGVIQLTRTAAAELGPKGIRANAVAPGFIETPMTQRTWTGADGSVDEAKRSEVLVIRGAQSPLSTTGEPTDIAGAFAKVIEGLS